MHPQWACMLRENRLRRHLEEGDDLRALSAATAASARLPARCQPSCSGGGQIGGGRRGRVRPALAGRTVAARELLGALIAHSSDDHQRVLRVPQQLHRSVHLPSQEPEIEPKRASGAQKLGPTFYKQLRPSNKIRPTSD